MNGFDLPLGPSLMLGFWTPGFWEILLILMAGLLLFGRRLPEVGRSLGRSIVEFKQGMRDVKSEIDREPSREPADPRRIPTRGDAVPRSTVEADEAHADRS
ncbi:MAG: twin-arginine translocase TatA/TatE family subunit [Phycisphaeraceae bacterium]|nr:twin-arginine translocase TatA/TatE family subunit [Phycisphaeraceae bacterium]